jgi:hypothetical protein
VPIAGVFIAQTAILLIAVTKIPWSLCLPFQARVSRSSYAIGAVVPGSVRHATLYGPRASRDAHLRPKLLRAQAIWLKNDFLATRQHGAGLVAQKGLGVISWQLLH